MSYPKKEHFSLPLKIDKLKQQVEESILNKQDLSFTVYQQNKKLAAIFFIPYIIDQQKLEEQLLHTLLQMEEDWSSMTILNEIPLSQGKTTAKMEVITRELKKNKVFIYVEEEKNIVFYELTKAEKRSLEKA